MGQIKLRLHGPWHGESRGFVPAFALPIPFTYLGNAERVSYESERQIKMVWRLHNQIPVEMFEENRRGG